MDIAPIKTERDCRNALKEIERLMTARRNTPEGDRLDVLATLVEPGSGSIIGSIFRTRWKRSSIIWTRMGFNRATLFPSSAAATGCTKSSIAGARSHSK